MSETPRPMIYHGDTSKETPEETALLDAAIQRFSELMNTVPLRLRGDFVSSILMTACMNQEDPQGALEGVVSSVVDAMRISLAKPEGNG